MKYISLSLCLAVSISLLSLSLSLVISALWTNYESENSTIRLEKKTPEEATSADIEPAIWEGDIWVHWTAEKQKLCCLWEPSFTQFDHIRFDWFVEKSGIIS